MRMNLSAALLEIESFRLALSLGPKWAVSNGVVHFSMVNNNHLLFSLMHPEDKEHFIILTSMQPLEAVLLDTNHQIYSL